MTSAADRALVVAEFDAAAYPGGAPTLDAAWLGIYQVLWWYVSPLLPLRSLVTDAPHEVREAFDTLETYIVTSAGTGTLHVREANDMKKPVWRARAAIAEAYLAGALEVPTAAVPAMLDRMMRLPRWVGQQRNNPLGNGLRMLVAEVARRWGNPAFTYHEETKATDWFPGIVMAGRSVRPSIDVALSHGDLPKAIVSCKWSIRHDRVSDPTNECTAYLSAAIQRQIMDLRYFVVTNELDGQRLDKILNQPCVTGLVHVHLDMVRAIGGETPRMQEAIAAGRLHDLADWVASTHAWS